MQVKVSFTQISLFVLIVFMCFLGAWASIYTTALNSPEHWSWLRYVGNSTTNGRSLLLEECLPLTLGIVAQFTFSVIALFLSVKLMWSILKNVHEKKDEPKHELMLRKAKPLADMPQMPNEIKVFDDASQFPSEIKKIFNDIVEKEEKLANRAARSFDAHFNEEHTPEPKKLRKETKLPTITFNELNPAQLQALIKVFGENFVKEMGTTKGGNYPLYKAFSYELFYRSRDVTEATQHIWAVRILENILERR